MSKQVSKYNENGVITNAVKGVIDSIENLNKSLEIEELSNMFDDEIQKQNTLQQEIENLEIPTEENIDEYKMNLPQDLDFMMKAYRYLKLTTEQLRMKHEFLSDATQRGCIYKGTHPPSTEMDLDSILENNKFQCVICLSNDIPMSQICYFSGCTHYSCISCVNGLRTTNNSVGCCRCPTCRKMISHIIYPTKIGNRSSWTCQLATIPPTPSRTGAYTSLDIIYNDLPFYDIS